MYQGKGYNKKNKNKKKGVLSYDRKENYKGRNV